MAEKKSSDAERVGEPKFDPMGFSPMRVGQWGFAPFFGSGAGAGRAPSTPIEFWISLFPTAPFFGLRWAFAPAEAADFSSQGQNERAREQAALSAVRLRSDAGERPDVSALGGLSARFASDLPAARLRVVEDDKPAPAAPLSAAAQMEKAKLEKVKPLTPKPAAAKSPAKASPAKTAEAKTAETKAPAPEKKPAAKKAPAKKPAAAKGPRPTKKPGQPFATYDAAPPSPDDLTKIKGVGEKLAAVLNDRGIYTFEQIAAFDQPAYQWLDDTLGAFKGRGERDDWAGQAKALMKKG